MRLERGQPHVLNADDLIGFGSGEAQSSRTDGQESFVYRLRAPAAFQFLEADDLDLPDSEAPTPPPPDLHDLVPDRPLEVPSIANLAPQNTASMASSHVASSSPSTSNKLPSGSQRSDTIELISLTSSEDDRSMSPVPSPEKTDKVRIDRKRSQDPEETGSSKKKVKKLKALFSSDEEESKEKSAHQKKRTNVFKSIKSNQNDSKFPSQYSPISSDDDVLPSPDLKLPRPVSARAMDLSTKIPDQGKVKIEKSEEEPSNSKTVSPLSSPKLVKVTSVKKDPASKSEPPRPRSKNASQPVDSSFSPEKTMKEESRLKELAAKIIAFKEMHDLKGVAKEPKKPEKDEKPMVKIEFDPDIIIKKEPVLELVPVPPKIQGGGYSSEQEVITLEDSDDEESLVKALSADTRRDMDIIDDHGSHLDHLDRDDDSDDEVQIISASETGLFAAISKRIKVEVEEQLPDDVLESLESASLDDYHGELDSFINSVIEMVGCNYQSALEGLEMAKDKHKKEIPSVEEVVAELAGIEDESEYEETFDGRMRNEGKEKPIAKPTIKVKVKPEKSKESNVVQESKKKESGSILEKNRRYSSDIDDLLGNSSSSDEEGKQQIKASNKEDKKESLSHLHSNIDHSQPSTSLGSVKPLPSLKKQYKVPKVVKSTKRISQSPLEVEKNSMLSFLKSSRPSPVKVEQPKTYAEVKDLRKQKLADIEKKKKKQDQEVVRDNNIPAGIMKASVPKSQRLLNEFASSENLQPKRKPTKSNAIPKRSKLSLPKKYNTSESEEQAKLSNVKDDVNKDLLYKETSDGYRVPKKMSVANVTYSSHDSSLDPMSKSHKPSTQPLTLKSILNVKKTKRMIQRKLRWKDQDGFNELALIKYIPAENQGKRVTKQNNKDFSVKVKVVPASVSSTPDNKDKKIITPDDILMTILTWNPAWLEEQKNQTEPPPVHPQWQLIPVTTTYSSWWEYRRIFLPLMLQELWSVVTRDYEEKKGFGGSSLPVFLQEITPEHGGQFLNVRCLAVMSEQQMRADLGHEGSLVQLEVQFTVTTPDGKRMRQVKPSFAYVWFNQKGDRNIGEADSVKIRQLQSLSVKGHGQAVYNQPVYITLRTKQHLIPPNSQLSVDKPVRLKSLSRIKPELRKFTALLELPQSRLFESIIKPSRELVSVTAPSSLHPGLMAVPDLARLNSTQKEIISSVAIACVSRQDMAKVCLVQGPPGTGKSSTITGLILQILLSSSVTNNPRSMSRILCVAPSNAAVDQLALKLISVQSQLPEHLRFKCLRLGVNSSMHPAVRPFSFDAVLEQQKVAFTRQSKATESMEKDLKAKLVTAESLKSEQTKAERLGQRDLAAKLRRDHKEKMHQIDKIRAEMRKPLNNKGRKDTERVAVERTLAEADVILTTLSSSLTFPMERYLVQGQGLGTSKSVGYMRPVSVCIMDEASQAVEPEALIPLKFGFCKLVMVGDHEQLPATVTSRKAQSLDYQQSLFSRLISFMGATPGPSPVLRLDTQYRMHPDIGDWPARYFYGGKLSHGATGRDKASYLTPFTLCDVVGETKQAGSGIWNKVEVKVVMSAIEAVQFLAKEKLSIGVITFYARQKQHILAEVNSRRLGHNTSVNTVDGFQGSERDVIIISCVRSDQGQGIGFLQDKHRLNVALTRAKHCLIVIGDTTALRFAILNSGYIGYIEVFLF